MKTAQNPQGATITFNAEAHAYYTDQVSPLTSVTTFVKHYFPPFDAPAVAAHVAQRDGKTVDMVLAEWKHNGDEAAAMGTRVHEHVERLIQGLPAIHVAQSERERGIMQAGSSAVAWLLGNGWQLLGAELIVFSENLGLAGTIDLAMRDDSGELWLLDWKTNKKITVEGYNGATALRPISHLPDCHMSQYSLQLSTYERLLRVEGYIDYDEPVNRALIHLQPSGEWHAIPVPYLHKEVSDMLVDLLSTSWPVPF